MNKQSSDNILMFDSKIHYDELIEQYKLLRIELTNSLNNITSIFYYGLVTLGISFTALQALFNQLNDFPKTTSLPILNQIHVIFDFLWILEIFFIPFICVIFTFKWLSIARSIAIFAAYLCEIESSLAQGIHWETDLRDKRDKERIPFFIYGSWHPIIVLSFFILIGFMSQCLWWLSVDETSPIKISLSVVFSCIYIFFVHLAFQQFNLINQILKERSLTNLKQDDFDFKKFDPCNFSNPTPNQDHKVEQYVLFFISSLLILEIIFNVFGKQNTSQIDIISQKIIYQYGEQISKLIESNLDSKNKLLLERTLTLETLNNLDQIDTNNPAKNKVINFLSELQLIGYPKKADNSCDNPTTKVELIDLQEANLQNVDFSGKNLRCMNLSGANLTKANLRGADLTGANLTGADLTGANIEQTKLIDISSDQNKEFISACNIAQAIYVENNEENEQIRKQLNWIHEKKELPRLTNSSIPQEKAKADKINRACQQWKYGNKVSNVINTYLDKLNYY
ncbi:pentapeptide repeat protein [Gloeothece citriformis PCC 7424]|uniref:Pentapeptide repeat protein n=1 Tax=Gloeothece citriformis (strain PCC 7424) TaxID=65393 RepID=B7KC30_GLOC7|nr:pentapeptide repeat-containing protein [Gloeothece citriformis]ACK68853.1 pentapeptide repeat protein [Gloeothece citriformis PCC 7424]